MTMHPPYVLFAGLWLACAGQDVTTLEAPLNSDDTTISEVVSVETTVLQPIVVPEIRPIPMPSAVVPPPPLPLPEPITFGVVGDGPDGTWGADLSVLLPAAIDRWREATCIDLQLSGAPENWVSWGKHPQIAAGRLGQTTSRDGTWKNTQILVGRLPIEADSEILAHEIGHVLAQTNDHTAAGLMAASLDADVITEDVLDYVCKGTPCPCRHAEVMASK